MVPRCSTTWRAVYGRTIPANRGLSNHSWVSLISRSNDLVRALLGSDNKIEILCNPRSVSLEGLDVGPDAGSGIGEVVIVQVQVQEIDVPGQLDAIGHVGSDDLACDGQRGRLRIVVDVAVTGGEQLLVFFVEQAGKKRQIERIAGFGARLRVVLVELRALVKPFPEDADPDLAGRHVLH